MNCTFATLDGINVLVNFKKKDGKVMMVIQEMGKELQGMYLKTLEISDLTPSVAIINGKDVLQMNEDDLAYIYSRFHIAMK